MSNTLIIQDIQRSDLLDQIRIGLKDSPAVHLVRARQAGKSTLANQIVKEWSSPTKIYDLENPESRLALEHAPSRILNQATGLVVIDEIQRMPHLFELLRPILNNRKKDKKAVFLLLGSAAPEIVQGVTETLYGRFQYVDVGGFTLNEVGSENLNKLWWRGGLPDTYLSADNDEWHRRMLPTTRSMIERDLSYLAPGMPSETIQRFWRMLATYHGQKWNASIIAGSMGMKERAVDRYRDILKATYMIRILYPWARNTKKRLTKSPKVYLRDSGVLHYLLGLHNEDELAP